MKREYRLMAKGKCIGFISTLTHSYAEILDYAIKVCEADSIEFVINCNNS